MSTPYTSKFNSGSGTPIGSGTLGGVAYRCGDCGQLNIIKGSDPVRCRHCGFRILYKIRTKRCKFSVCFDDHDRYIHLAILS